MANVDGNLNKTTDRVLFIMSTEQDEILCKSQESTDKMAVRDPQETKEHYTKYNLFSVSFLFLSHSRRRREEIGRAHV